MKLKKSISLIVEYVLLTFVSITLLTAASIYGKEIIKKIKIKEEREYFKKMCNDFNLMLKNSNGNFLYYFKYNIKSENNKLILLSDKDYFCPLDFKLCEKSLRGRYLVIKNNNQICFKKY